jgi:hypothetical protein
MKTTMMTMTMMEATVEKSVKKKKETEEKKLNTVAVHGGGSRKSCLKNS